MEREVVPVLPVWLNTTAFGRDGGRLGVVADILFDVHTHTPAWVIVRTEAGDVLAPARRLRHHRVGVVLPCPAELVHSAPVALSPPGELGPEQARALAAHYGVRCGGGPWRGVIEPTIRERSRLPVPRLRA